MQVNTPTAILLVLNATLISAVALLLSSCRASPLIPYAVELVPPAKVVLPALPQVLPESSTVNPDYREYKAVNGDQRYFVPLSLTEQAVREANALNSERAANYEAQIGELNGRLDATKIGQHAIEQQFSWLFERLQKQATRN